MIVDTSALSIYNELKYENGMVGLTVGADSFNYIKIPKCDELQFLHMSILYNVKSVAQNGQRVLLILEPKPIEVESLVNMDNSTIKVLDHGHVRLVDVMGSDLSIVRAARVSYDADWRAGNDEGSDMRLIHYLMKNHHTTPFEMVEFTFDVKLPIFVIRQWHRHRTWSYNEVSARYTELPEQFYLPSPAVIGKQSQHNKQARDILDTMTDQELRAAEEEIQWVQEHCYNAFELYHKLLIRGWPRELARIVLPFATYTHMHAKVDLHNLMHFLRLRLHSHAQYEIRQYALAILELIEPVVPVAVDAFKKYVLQES